MADEFSPESGSEGEEIVEERAADSSAEAGGAPEWMVTFGDMMSLLLCFFVLIVSFSTMDAIKYRNLVGSLREAFGASSQTATQIIDGQIATAVTGEGFTGDQSLTDDALEHELAIAVEEEGLTGVATLQRTDRGLVLSLRSHLLFASGSAEIRPAATGVLGRVGEVCRYFHRRIHIEGHTDNLPSSSARHPSNWELSAARASAVVRYLLDLEHLPPERFVASGYAATEPIASNRREAGRSRNRRVEFIFSRDPDRD